MNKRQSIRDRDKYFVLSRDAFSCQYCGRKAPDVVLHVDHILPVARGGKNNLTNLISACDSCNYGKGAQLLPDTLIKEKSADILERTKKYEAYLASVPDAQKQPSPKHLLKRPRETLNKLSFISEPLKERAIHPEKRHLLEVYVVSGQPIELAYHRYFRGHWETVSIKDKILNPINAKQLKQLMQDITYELYEEVIECGESVFVHRSDSGFWLIQVDEGAFSYYYPFWTPAKELEVHLSFAQGWTDTVHSKKEAFKKEIKTKQRERGE